jgi:hypothetical protein
MSKYLDLGTAIFALLASFFWFASASGSMPLIITNWGSTPEADPYRLALITAPKWNSIAAFFSGLSALCASASWAASRTLGARTKSAPPS